MTETIKRLRERCTGWAHPGALKDRDDIITVLDECDQLKAELEQLNASLPLVTNRTYNDAAKALGKVYRLTTDESRNASIGVVDVNRATEEMVAAYGRAEKAEQRAYEFEAGYMSRTKQLDETLAEVRLLRQLLKETRNKETIETEGR